MPIYEYRCGGCAQTFEVRQRMSDPAPETHACGSKDIKRLLSATSFVLKGTGWYATDYGNRSAPPAEEGAPAKKDKGEGGKTEAKGEGSKGDGKTGGDKAAVTGGDKGGGKSDKAPASGNAAAAKPAAKGGSSSATG